MLPNTEHKKNIGWANPLPYGLAAVSTWLPLISYGTFSQFPGDVQKLSKPEANEIINHYHSLGGFLLRRFQGLPVILDYKILCGFIHYLEARDHALWAIIDWNDIGKEVMQERSQHWFINPAWITKLEEGNVYTPFKLVEIILSRKKMAKPKTGRKTSLNKKSITENLLGKSDVLPTCREQVLALVNDHMKKTGDDYLQSWSIIKQKNPHLYHNI